MESRVTFRCLKDQRAHNRHWTVYTDHRKENGMDQPAPTPKPSISDDERRRREKAVAYARGSVRLEGFILDDAAEALFARYVQGEIDRPELDAAVAKLAASYG